LPTPHAVRNQYRHPRPDARPRPAPAPPPPPDHFAGLPELAVWQRVCDTLADMGLLTAADWAAVERYCVDLVLWRACVAFLRKSGATYTLRSANPAVPHLGEIPNTRPVMYATARARHPEWAIKADLERAMRAFETSFGLSPGARTRLSAPAPGPALADADEPAVRARVRG
jgi:P27 family predicted phage terminase small subunit